MDKIKCKLDDSHCAIDHVKKLPCGNLCCIDCIKHTLNISFNGSFTCKACNQDHALRSANDLLDMDIDAVLIENESEILASLRMKLEKHMRNLEGNLVEILLFVTDCLETASYI